jgi:glutathione peroxidase
MFTSIVLTLTSVATFAQGAAGVGLDPESQRLPHPVEIESETTLADPSEENSRANDSHPSGTDSGKPQKKVNEQTMSESVYDFHAKSLDGKDIDLSSYKGDVMLIVNTASECGFTNQYKGLEELHEKYQDRGLKILGFPCNQFGGQEPGDNQQIASFCQKNFGVNFQMFEKIDVNGEDAHPLYKYLTKAAPGALGTKAIKWNFTKFLVDRQGKVLKRYAPTTKPEDLRADIEKQL